MTDQQNKGDSVAGVGLPLNAVRTGGEVELEEMRARKDAAYEERNRVVAALAKVFPSGVARTAIEGWSEDWHGCVYIDLPTGQASWHFHDSQAHLFADLPPYAGEWDGHDTPEKYRRVAALSHPSVPTEASSGAQKQDHPSEIAELEQEASLMRARNERLQQERDALLDALRLCAIVLHGDLRTQREGALEIARAAIAKAEGRA